MIDLTGVFLGTGPAQPTASSSSGSTTSSSTPGPNTNTGTWMNDGTTPQDSGFDSFMQQVAYDGFKRDVDSWIKQTGGDPSDPTTFANVPLTADGKSIDYTKVDMGGQGHTLAAYTQELGEGNQGQTLYSMYQKGLTADQVKAAYDKSGTYQLGDATGGQDANGGLPNQSLFSHSSQTGANTGLMWFDPNKGFVTSPTNFHHGGWDMVGNLLPVAIMGAMTLGAGEVIGAAAAAGTGLADSGMTAADLGASEAAGISGAPAGSSLGAINGGGLLGGQSLLNAPQRLQGITDMFTKPSVPAASSSSSEASSAASGAPKDSTPLTDLTSFFLGKSSAVPTQNNNGIVNNGTGS